MMSELLLLIAVFSLAHSFYKRGEANDKYAEKTEYEIHQTNNFSWEHGVLI